MKIGLAPDSPDRIKAGLLYSLEKAADEGHCYLPIDVWCSRLRGFAGELIIPLGSYRPQVERLVSEGASCSERRIFLSSAPRSG